jgi:hypothetical protein
MSAARKVNGGSEATRITPDSGRKRLSAQSEASIPQAISELANEAMMGGWYEHGGSVPYRQLWAEKLETQGRGPVHDVSTRLSYY